MKMISYAQNGEDVLLNRLFPADHRGFYIDVGACHPSLHSVTKHFYDRGWRGVNIEPVESVFALLKAGRPEDVNLQVGLSDREGTLTLHESSASFGMSTFCPDFARDLKREGYPCVERHVPVTTLARVCEAHAARPIDFLKIDVEGHETAVVRGGDWSRWRPRAVVVEAPVGPGPWEETLFGADYLFAHFDGLNRYYLRREDADLLPRLVAPVNLMDNYIPSEYHEPIQQLRRELADANAALGDLRAQLWQARARLAEVEDLGPRSIAIARRLKALSRAVPGLGMVRKRRRPAG